MVCFEVSSHKVLSVRSHSFILVLSLVISRLRAGLNVANLAGFQTIFFTKIKTQHSVNYVVHEERVHHNKSWRRHSHHQFPRSTLGTLGTMTPLLTTKNDLPFYVSGLPMEARVNTNN